MHLIEFSKAEFSGCAEILFTGKFGRKEQSFRFMLKCGTKINLNIQNSMVMFTFSSFGWEYPFWTNLVLKFKITYLE